MNQLSQETSNQLTLSTKSRIYDHPLRDQRNRPTVCMARKLIGEMSIY